MTGVHPFRFFFEKIKKRPLMLSFFISIVSLFMIFSHILEMILFLGFGGMFFLILELLLWPILFIISPGMIVTALILPRLDSFLVSFGKQAEFGSNEILMIVALAMFIMNALYYLLVSFLIKRYKLGLKDIFRCYATIVIALALLLSISVYKFGAVVFILFFVLVTIVKRYLGRKRS